MVRLWGIFDRGNGTGDRRHQTGQPQQEERKGQVLPPAGAFGQRFTDERQAGITHGELAFPAQNPDVDRDEQRDEQEQHK